MDTNGPPKIIEAFIHCDDCVREAREKGIAPKDYARLEIGLAMNGTLIQVWCNRHEQHVAGFKLARQFDFECVECQCDACKGEGEVH